MKLRTWIAIGFGLVVLAPAWGADRITCSGESTHGLKPQEYYSVSLSFDPALETFEFSEFHYFPGRWPAPRFERGRIQKDLDSIRFVSAGETTTGSEAGTQIGRLLTQEALPIGKLGFSTHRQGESYELECSVTAVP